MAQQIEMRAIEKTPKWQKEAYEGLSMYQLIATNP